MGSETPRQFLLEVEERKEAGPQTRGPGHGQNRGLVFLNIRRILDGLQAASDKAEECWLGVHLEGLSWEQGGAGFGGKIPARRLTACGERAQPTLRP